MYGAVEKTYGIDDGDCVSARTHMFARDFLCSIFGREFDGAMAIANYTHTRARAHTHTHHATYTFHGLR